VFCTTTAIFGSYGVLFAKCTSIVVQVAFSTNDFDIQYQFFIWLACSSICGSLNIYFLNKSLASGTVGFVIPVLHALSLVLQLALGGAFFDEYASFSLTKHLEFWPGVLVVLCCIALLSRDQARLLDKASSQAHEQNQSGENEQSQSGGMALLMRK